MHTPGRHTSNSRKHTGLARLLLNQLLQFGFTSAIHFWDDAQCEGGRTASNPAKSSCSYLSNQYRMKSSLKKVNSAILLTAYSWADNRIIWQRVRASAFWVRRYSSCKALCSAFDKLRIYRASGIASSFFAHTDSMPIPKNSLGFI